MYLNLQIPLNVLSSQGSATFNSLVPLARLSVARLPPGPTPSSGFEASLHHPNFPHPPHSSSEKEASVQTLYLVLFASELTKNSLLHVQETTRSRCVWRRLRLTCRFLTLSETFSWDMLRSALGSVAGSSGIKMLSCERARDPMGFSSLRENARHRVIADIHLFIMRRRDVGPCTSYRTKGCMTSFHTPGASAHQLKARMVSSI